MHVTDEKKVFFLYKRLFLQICKVHVFFAPFQSIQSHTMPMSVSLITKKPILLNFLGEDTW